MNIAKTILQKIGLGAISAIVSILVLLNFSSGILGGIWLLLSGGIGLIFWGIILGIVMPWLYTIATLPAMLLTAISLWAIETRKIVIAAVVAFILNVYQTIVLAYWVLYVFGTFVSYSKEYPVIALLLCGYSTMMAPLSYMASHEGPDSYGTTLTLLMSQFLYIIITFVWLFNIGNWLEIVGIFVLIYSLLIAFVVIKAFPQSSTSSENDSLSEVVEINPQREILGIESKTNQDTKKYCNKCGNIIISLATYCSICGNKL